MGYLPTLADIDTSKLNEIVDDFLKPLMELSYLIFPLDACKEPSNARINHLVARSRKFRVRKKNIARLWKWQDDNKKVEALS